MATRKQLYKEAKEKRNKECPKALSKMTKKQLADYVGKPHLAMSKSKKPKRSRNAGGGGYFSRDELKEIKEDMKPKLKPYQRKKAPVFKSSGKKKKLSSKK